MKRHFLNFFGVPVVIFFSIIACNKDNNGNYSNPHIDKELVGTWVNGYLDSYGYYRTYKYIFNGNGAFKYLRTYSYTTHIAEGSYTTSNGIIYFTDIYYHYANDGGFVSDKERYEDASFYYIIENEGYNSYLSTTTIGTPGDGEKERRFSNGENIIGK
jgi:hypothetical protein